MPAVQSRLAFPWVERSKRPASIVVPLLCVLYYLRKRLIAAAVAKQRQGAFLAALDLSPLPGPPQADT